MVNENLATELQGTIHALSIVVSKCWIKCLIHILKEIWENIVALKTLQLTGKYWGNVSVEYQLPVNKIYWHALDLFIQVHVYVSEGKQAVENMTCPFQYVT